MSTADSATTADPSDSPREPELINLTPHPITLVGIGRTVQIPPSGAVARIEYRTTVVSGYLHDVPVLIEAAPVVTGLPRVRPGTYWIVSRAVLQACPHRADLYSPAHFERDADGVIRAARILVTNPATAAPPHAAAR